MDSSKARVRHPHGERKVFTSQRDRAQASSLIFQIVHLLQHHQRHQDAVVNEHFANHLIVPIQDAAVSKKTLG
jgi:hypothetical protein